MFIILLHYKVEINEVEKFVPVHRAYLKAEGFDKELIIAAGPCVPRTGGVIIFNSNDRKAAETFVAEDPFIIEKVAEAEIIEFNPTFSLIDTPAQFKKL